MADSNLWHETLHDHFGQYFSVDNVLYHEKTDHQDLIIFENAAFGRVMALDGVVQTTERDEFIYHEMLTHVPLMAHGQAKHVLIIGGGDGAMLREVSRHRNIETITMVEIDAGVVSFCRQYLLIIMLARTMTRALRWLLTMASILLIKPRKRLTSLSPTAPILSVPARACSLPPFTKAANAASIQEESSLLRTALVSCSRMKPSIAIVSSAITLVM